MEGDAKNVEQFEFLAINCSGGEVTILGVKGERVGFRPIHDDQINFSVSSAYGETVMVQVCYINENKDGVEEVYITGPKDKLERLLEKVGYKTTL